MIKTKETQAQKLTVFSTFIHSKRMLKGKLKNVSNVSNIQSEFSKLQRHQSTVFFAQDQ